jgi:ubiquinone/menaquinone biosynthesis C-methylase UbiE
LGFDISDAVCVARDRFREIGCPGQFVKCDLMALPVLDNSIELIFSKGVLHHTDSTRVALLNLARKLKRGGRFLFYVYATKAPIREFTDDNIRGWLSSLNDQEAWEALQPLTKLGVALGKLGVEIDIPEDVPYLGIRKGKIYV